MLGRLSRESGSKAPSCKGGPVGLPTDAPGHLKGHLCSGEPVPQAEPIEMRVSWLQEPPGRRCVCGGGGCCPQWASRARVYAAGPLAPGATACPSTGLHAHIGVPASETMGVGGPAALPRGGE